MHAHVPYPRLQVKRLAEHMCGSGPCPWATWRAMRGSYERLPSDFDSVGWSLDHNAMVNRCASDLRAEGFSVFTERQNAFKILVHECGGSPLPSPIYLVGRPDLVAVRGGGAHIIDCKTGQPSDVHRVQVLLYELLVPCNAAAPYAGQLAREVLECRVVYKAHPAVTLPQEARGITPMFLDALCAAIRALTDPVEPTPEPSDDACRFCDVAACPARFERRKQPESSTFMLI